MTMDIKQRFERRVSERAVAQILGLIADSPSRRDRSRAGDAQGTFDYWFDGGAARTHTGSVEYEFLDGTTATVAAPIPALSVEICFANGCRVKVQQESWGTEDE
jgi:hypothetical protein